MCVGVCNVLSPLPGADGNQAAAKGWQKKEKKKDNTLNESAEVFVATGPVFPGLMLSIMTRFDDETLSW